MAMGKRINIQPKRLLGRVIIHPSNIEKWVTLESTFMPSTSMGDLEGNSDSEVEEV